MAEAGAAENRPGRTLDDESTTNDAEARSKYKFDEDYEIHDKLGKGSFGVVYVTKHLATDQEFVVKEIDKNLLSKKDTDSVCREVSILRECRDVENIVRLVDFYESPTHYHLVLVWAQGGDVFKRLSSRNSYTEKDARDLAQRLLGAMEILHRRRIAHRDLKPENLLLYDMLDDSAILVGDFGFAKKVPDHGLTTRCGTPAFVAPEILEQKCKYYENVDMWSVGCLLYMLIGGYPPFQDRNHRGLFRKIRGADFCFHEVYWKNVSVSAKQLISSMLTVDPAYRCTAALALTKSNWLKIDNRVLDEHDLSTSLGEMRKFQARRSLKGAMTAVLWSVQTRFKSIGDDEFSKQVKTWDEGDEKKAQEQAKAGGEQQDDYYDKDRAPRRLSLLRPTIKFHQVYDLGKKLHSGRAVTVYECTLKDGGENPEVFAVKIVDRKLGSQAGPGGRSISESLLHELAVLRSLSHKYILDIVDFYEDPDQYYLVMELMSGGDVYDRILHKKKYTEKDARDLSKVLLEGVQYLHAQGIAHRDLKPQNLLLKNQTENANIKISDFNFACRVHTPQSLTTRCGTPSYVAPEILKNIPYDQRADMWSVGVIIYVLLCGYPPFQDEDQGALFAAVRQGNWQFDGGAWDAVSEDAKDLIRHLLVVDPVSRWTAEQAIQCKWLGPEYDNKLDSKDLSHIPATMKKRRTKLQSLARTVMMMNSTRKMMGRVTIGDSKERGKAVEEVLARSEES